MCDHNIVRNRHIEYRSGEFTFTWANGNAFYVTCLFKMKKI